MAYTKQTWEDFNASLPLSAARMAYIEDGIEAAHDLAGGGGGSADTPFVLVAAADSPAAYKTFADFVCTGTSGNRIDHTTIQNAYNSLPAAGGEVWLAPGTYYFGGTLLVDREDCDLRFSSGAIANWSTITGTTPIVQVTSSNASVFNPECVGSGTKGNGTGIMIGGNTGQQPHNVNIWEPRCYNMDAGVDFAVEPPGGSDNSTGDCAIWGGRLYNCKDGLRSSGFVNHVHGPFISNCDIGIHQTTARNSGKLVIHSATVNNSADVAVAIDRGRGATIDNLWVEHTTGSGPTEVIRLGSASYTVVNPYIGKAHLHPLDGGEQYVIRLVRCRGLVADHIEITDDLPTVAAVRVDTHADNSNNRIRKLSMGDAAPAGWNPATMILSNASPNTYPVIIEEIPNIAGSAAGSTLGGQAIAHTEATFTIFKDGAGTYFAKHRNGHIQAVGIDVAATTSGLKAVLDLLKATGVWFHFATGTFSFLDDVSGQFNATFNTIHGLSFTGEGIENTIIRSLSNAVAGSDNEPLSFTHCHRGTMRDLQLRCEGVDRQTSDAFDLDGGNDWLVERVWVSYSRGNGFHTDGKDDAAWPARNNTFRDCIAENCKFDGFELLASEDSTVDNCRATNNGVHGLQIAKGSSSAGIPNKKSARNRVVGGVFEENGSDGINILSSDDNVITGGARCLNNANITASRDGIRIETTNSISADRNIIEGNVATDTQGVKTQRYGVNVQPATSTEANDNVVATNALAGNLTRGGNDTGTNTRWTDNPGFRTRSKGSSTVSGTGASATQNITHNLDRTPTNILISPTNAVATVQPHVTTKGASNFTVTFTAPSGTNNVAFDWVAEF